MLDGVNIIVDVVICGIIVRRISIAIDIIISGNINLTIDIITPSMTLFTPSKGGT